ncbi:3'(2'),5'-bisphosphate nucleotidase CysQ [Ruegeria marina]|uniref:3'(2'),5'-bisphosphate nucleotidase CysQ n=1 Tax=Ruegeria marina TaxID=639004 RepID=A0A1G6K092_9RHOB|nr:3'(2'),5'-bisphosphate nucleotidase CysQ [Ruegeria marina]SDC23706.1 3'(2'), 5'-bisphosphate nucleotidase [Ruegeria marina]
MHSHETLIAALTPVVRDAGARIMEIYAQPPQADQKGDGSPVTAADVAAEAVILTALARIAPDIPIVSEENADSHGLDAPERFFLVDPLDGTKEFLKRDGKGSFTVNIALIEGGVPVMGIVYAPALNQLFCGAVGVGATEDRGTGARPITTRTASGAGRIAVASASHRDAETDAWLAAEGITNTVSIGSSLKFCFVAAGEADVYPRFGTTMEWDTAAGDAVLRAAGGSVQNPDGTPFVYAKPRYRNGAFVARGGPMPA